MTHELNIEIPFITNPKVLKIFDTSVWDVNTPSTELKLEITPPGFIYPVSFMIKRGFDKLFNSSNLGIHVVTDLKDLADLQDGIYIVRLITKNLNDEQFIEFNHLRQTKALNQWYKSLCKLRLSPCDNLIKDVEEQRKKLYQIRAYLDAAKADVEYCNIPNEGLELHQYAQKLLNKFDNSCKNC